MIQSKKLLFWEAGLSGITRALNLQEKEMKLSFLTRTLKSEVFCNPKESMDTFLIAERNTLSLRSQKKKAFLEKHHILEHALDANQLVQKRFIVRNSKLVTLPQNFLSFLKSPFLSPLGKMRLLVEPFIPEKQ